MAVFVCLTKETDKACLLAPMIARKVRLTHKRTYKSTKKGEHNHEHAKRFTR